MTVDVKDSTPNSGVRFFSVTVAPRGRAPNLDPRTWSWTADALFEPLDLDCSVFDFDSCGLQCTDPASYDSCPASSSTARRLPHGLAGVPSRQQMQDFTR